MFKALKGNTCTCLDMRICTCLLMHIFKAVFQIQPAVHSVTFTFIRMMKMGQDSKASGWMPRHECLGMNAYLKHTYECKSDLYVRWHVSDADDVAARYGPPLRPAPLGDGSRGARTCGCPCCYYCWQVCDMIHPRDPFLCFTWLIWVCCVW